MLLGKIVLKSQNIWLLFYPRSVSFFKIEIECEFFRLLYSVIMGFVNLFSWLYATILIEALHDYGCAELKKVLQNAAF